MERKIIYSEIFKTAFKCFKSQIWILCGLVIGFTIIYSLLQIFAMPTNNETMSVSGIIASIIGVIFSMIFYMGYTKNCFQTLDGEEPQFSAYGQMSRKIGTYFCASLIYAIIILIGFALLIVPGIYLSLRLQFFLYAIVDEDAGIIESLKRSWDITKGQTLQLFVIVLIYLAIAFIGMAIFIIGIFAAIPIIYLMQCYVFRKLTVPTTELNQ